MCLFVIPYLAAFAAVEYCPPPGPTPGTPATPVPPRTPVPSPPPGPPETPIERKWISVYFVYS